jgi:hypothetical protein
MSSEFDNGSNALDGNPKHAKEKMMYTQTIREKQWLLNEDDSVLINAQLIKMICKVDLGSDYPKRYIITAQFEDDTDIVLYRSETEKEMNEHFWIVHGLLEGYRLNDG